MFVSSLKIEPIKTELVQKVGNEKNNLSVLVFMVAIGDEFKAKWFEEINILGIFLSS